MQHRATAGICEPDDRLRGILLAALRGSDFDVVALATGADAVLVFSARALDVLVLGIGLPDADGRDVCQALRAGRTASPVLFLSDRDTLADRLSGFHVGGDDYLTKPFALPELLARVRALARRAAPPAERAPEWGLVLDPGTHALIHGEQRTVLSPTEFRLLAGLMARPGEVVRRSALVSAAWPDGAVVQENTLDAFLVRIRRKLREVGARESVTTLRGIGSQLGEV